MKRILSILIPFFVLASCNNLPVEKPDHFIEEEMMTNILYDLTLFEVIKSQRKFDSVTNWVGGKEYVYNKYGIDSLQFVESHQYYISQIETYKKMYDQVNERLQSKKSENDLLLKKSEPATPSNPSGSDVPQVQ
jgi:hypothetical protein